MKLLPNFLTFILISMFYLPNTFAQDSPQWHLSEGTIARLGKDSIYEITSSPDGTQLAVASDTGIWLYDAHTGEELFTFTGHASRVYSVAFSPDGKTLASGSSDKTVYLWDVETGGLLQMLIGHASRVYSVAFSPDGKTLASGSSDKTVYLWDVETGGLLQTLTGHMSYVYSVAFSPDGKMLASGSYDDTIRLWDAKTGALLQTFNGHTSSVNSVVFSPNGKMLASGSQDGTIRLWNTEISLDKQIFTRLTEIFGLVIVCLIVIGIIFLLLLTRKSRTFLKEHNSQLSSEDPKVLLGLSEKCDEYLKDRYSAEIRRLSQQAKTKAAKVQKKMDFEANLETFKSETLEGGSHPAVVSTLKDHMHNPDSFQHVSSNYETVKEEGKHYCKIVMVFRGTNTFGALVLQTCFFVFDEANRISLVGSPNDAESSSLNMVTLSESIDAVSSLFDGVASAANLLSLFDTDE